MLETHRCVRSICHFRSVLNTDIYGLADIYVHVLPDSAESWQTQSSDTFSWAGRKKKEKKKKPLDLRFYPPFGQNRQQKSCTKWLVWKGSFTGNSPGLSKGKQISLPRQKIWETLLSLQTCPKTSPWETRRTHKQLSQRLSPGRKDGGTSADTSI